MRIRILTKLFSDSLTRMLILTELLLWKKLTSGPNMFCSLWLNRVIRLKTLPTTGYIDIILPNTLTIFFCRKKRGNLLIKYSIEWTVSSIYLPGIPKEKDVEFHIKLRHSKHCTGCKIDFSKLIIHTALINVSLTKFKFCKQV